MNDYVIRDSEGVDLDILAAVEESLTGRATKRPCPYDDPNCTGKHRGRKSGMCPSAYKRKQEHSKEWGKENAERVKELNREWRTANAERRKEYMKEYEKVNAERKKEYYAANAERYKEYGKEYYAANAERIKEREKEYRAANAERYKEYQKEWRAANPEAVRANKHRRRERIKSRAGRYDSQIVVQPTCHLCRLPIKAGQPTHVDHIIALNEPMPDSVLSGLRVCHATCNLSRGDKPVSVFLLDNLRRQ